MSLTDYRVGLDRWLDDNAAELVPAAAGTLDDDMAHLSHVRRMMYDAGWMRWGWPESVAGYGGTTLMRAYLGEALAARDLVHPDPYCMAEVLAPTVINFAPDLAATMVPRLIRGDDTWCQGFSEPGTGSNLASLSCRAVRVADAWRVSGQKVWTSFAQYAHRCVLLTRTGSAESAHRGITALFVDMDTPGISVRPIRTMHGRDEFCEVFFDDVPVPIERTIGAVDGGWAVAMDLLPYERSTSLWHRGAYLRRRVGELLAHAGRDAVAPDELGAVVQQLFALRARSRATQYRHADGEALGAETSIDKLLVASTEQAVFDLVAAALPAEVLLDEAPAGARWREEFFYSKAATIYGGSTEVQRNIVAKRLLDLGADR